MVIDMQIKFNVINICSFVVLNVKHAYMKMNEKSSNEMLFSFILPTNIRI